MQEIAAVPRGLASSALPCRNSGRRCVLPASCHVALPSASDSRLTFTHRSKQQHQLRSSFLSQKLSSPKEASTAASRSSRHQHRHGRSTQVQAFFDLPEAGLVRDMVVASGGAILAFTISAALAIAMRWNEKKVKAAAEERGPASIPEPGVLAQALEMGLGVGGQKESVEWVNMVFHKIWKVYRRSLEAWLVGLLQPAIDTLPLPSIVRRVEIAEFSLDYEPLSVRNVQRRASRRANDLQYHVGLRYTGDARCLLLLHLTVAGVDFAVPVGVHNLDVDAELWVKIRLTPRQPYVGTLSIGFVRLPTIKLVLAPFRIVNLFAIPFLSSFLSKLLTVDLPRLLVLPRHITFDFLPAGEDMPPQSSTASASPAATSANMVLDLLKSETFTGLAEKEILSPARTEPSDHFVGELTVTLCEARNLPALGLSVFSNPYCRLMVGETAMESKRNSETSHPSGARDPVWNQDFLFWVEDPAQQKLTVVIRDSSSPLSRNIGFVEVPIWQLQDCAPLSMWLPLLQDGPFGVKPAQGEVRLLLTYKSYVDRLERMTTGGVMSDNKEEQGDDVVAYIKVFGSDESEEGEEVCEEEPDSDGERERELQRERERKGLDKLGEAAGVEVVASNQGQVVSNSVPPLPTPLSQGDRKVSGSPVPPVTAPPAAAPEESKLGLVSSAWNATKAVTRGAVSVAGGVVVGAGGLLASAGGAVASFLAKRDEEAEAELYLYEDDDYVTEDPTAVKVTSYRSDADSDSDRERRRGGEGSQVEGDAEREMVTSTDDFVPEEMVVDPSYGPYSTATAEQQVARMMEWNLGISREDLLESLASAPRLREDGSGNGSLGESREAVAPGGPLKEEGKSRNVAEGEPDDSSLKESDRWRSVQGAISDLMDFFNR